MRGPDPREDALQQASVLERATAKGNEELDRLSGDDTPPQIVDQLRAVGQRRTHLAWERLGETRDDQPSPNEAYRRLRRKMLEKEREEVLRVRDTGTVDHEVLDQVMNTLDLEESMLTIADNRDERYNERVITTPEAQRGDCEHLRDAPAKARPQTPEGCADCLREGLVWVNLRMCLGCGNVGCCDSSIGNHATKHYQADAAPGDAQLRARRGLALVLRRRAPRLRPSVGSAHAGPGRLTVHGEPTCAARCRPGGQARAPTRRRRARSMAARIRRARATGSSRSAQVTRTTS